MFEELCQLAKSSSADLERIARLASQHLNALKKEVTRYFPELGEVDATMIRNPFVVNVQDVPARIQEQLIDLQTDSTAKDVFVGEKHLLSLGAKCDSLTLKFHRLPSSHFLCFLPHICVNPAFLLRCR